MLRLKKKKPEEEEQKKEKKGVEILPLRDDYKVLERYTIVENFADVVIASPRTDVLEPVYFVVEVPLTEVEEQVLEKLKDFIAKELEPPKAGEGEEVKKAMHEAARKILKKYGGILGKVSKENEDKLIYYLERDLLGFGPLNVIMQDYKVEDISCDGVNSFVYVWHRDYESIPTNIVFRDSESLDDYIIQLAHKAGKHISSAFPILDAMLYGKHRLAATFREEISPRGSTFTIRKFREKPVSIVELMKFKTLNADIAAYFWLLIENKSNIMVIGATGSGKTTSLNALASFIKPRMKVVTCEETAELNLPTENWVRFVTRESYGLGTSEVGRITLFDLVRASLRYRPDYLLVGEVRGEEAFVLFQAIATGHGGISTVHAESVDSAVKRFVSPPMNIPPSHISLLDALVLIERVNLPAARGGVSYGRRFRYLWEVIDYENYIKVAEWDPVTDSFKTHFHTSVVLEKIALRNGLSIRDLLLELENRKAVLEWMLEKNITDYRDVASVIFHYYADKEAVLKKVGVTRRIAPQPLVSPPPATRKVEATVPAQAKNLYIEEIKEHIIRILNASSRMAYWQVFANLHYPKDQILTAIRNLVDEGVIMISKEDGSITLKR